jgi:hypothetical protein
MNHSKPGLILLIILLATPALAHDEPCSLELLNVPLGATIRVSAKWMANDYDEPIEDEGYIFTVTEGGNGNTLSIWRHPHQTFTMSPFLATASRVVIIGRKDPASTKHSEGLEVEGCVIVATINSLPPWVKDYARNAFPYLTIGTAGLSVLGTFHPGIKVAALGVGFTAVVAKVLSDDPIDCSTSKVQKLPKAIKPPKKKSADQIQAQGDAIYLNGRNILNAGRTSVINANRAACHTFSDKQRAALFKAAQTDAAAVGAGVQALTAQLSQLAILLEQSGIIKNEQTDHSLSDWHFYFTHPDYGDPSLDPDYLQVLTTQELDDLKDGMMGIALLDFHANTILYPALWPDGVRWAIPALEQWAMSLTAREAGQ